MSSLKNRTFAFLLCLSTSAGLPALAQGIFSPVARVNDAVITEFEVEQRQRFLTLLNAPGSSRNAVIETLIDERLQAQAVFDAGLELTEEALTAGLDEFASRVNLSAEEFKTVLAENGVAPESFESFVSNGVAWRDFVSSRFGPRVQITEDEIDQALGSANSASTIRVLVSEIIIPAPEDRLQEVEEIAQQIAASSSEAEFSAFAQEFSATESRDNGGRLAWQSLANLPPPLRPLLLSLAPGEVTDPIAIPNAVALFQLRDIQETGAPSEQFAAIDYAAYYMPGGRSAEALQAAARLRAEVDVCNDLYGIAQDQPPQSLERGSKPVAEIPTDIALELSKLDPGETSIALTRNNGQTLVFLMLCGRTAAANEDVGRSEAAAALRNARLTAISDSFLDQLRAEARITLQ